MSGTMMPPSMQGGPQMPQGGGMPQLPPQVLQMLMQRMQGGGQMPGGQMSGPRPPMQGPQMQGPQMPNPGQGGMQGAPPPIPQPGQGGQAQQLAQQGRFGDSIVAHITPGEISVPPQIQTPQLIEALRQAFAHAGVSLQQFTAGSPQASRNPATGAPELSLWSALLPILGGVVGSVIPGLGTGVGAALGGAAGGAAGGLVDHQTPLGVGLSALGGAAGGYLGAPAGEAAIDTSTVAGANAAGTAVGATAGAPGSMGIEALPSTSNPFSGSDVGSTVKGFMPNLKAGLAAGTGAGLAGALAPGAQTNPLALAGFNKQLGPVNPSLAHGMGHATTPQFANYNPYAAVAGPNPGFNFFPGG